MNLESGADKSTETNKAPTKDWTIAFDLMESSISDKTRAHAAGVDLTLLQLQSLARETEGKSVNFVIHAEKTADEHLRPCDLAQPDADKTASCELEAQGHKRAITERYFIHDGQIDKLPAVQYKDSAQDLAALMHDTNSLAPAEHLGLVLDSHGDGNQGIEGNLGFLPLQKMTSVIKSGLTAGGHDKLDLLDFDSCDMAQLKVIDASNAVARDVVASEGLENLTYTNDSENKAAAMRALLADSKMSGGQLGRIFVDQARAGLNGSGLDNATPTLANFDLTNYGDFKSSLENFGTALATAAKNPQNLNLLELEIDHTKAAENAREEPLKHERDLKLFALQVSADALGHKFGDNSKAVQAAANNFIGSIEKLTTASYGNKEHGYENLGGLAAEIPGSEIMDKKQVAQEITPVRTLDHQLQTILSTRSPLSNKDVVVNYVQGQIEKIDLRTGLAMNDQMKVLEDGRDVLKHTSDLKSYLSALSTMQEAAAKVDRGPLQAALAAAPDNIRRASDIQLDYLNKTPEKISPEWDNFVGLMQEQLH